ncbi:hypothetical protein A10D4_08242 [Idiomarina xiamenensis 10-D-4]|uniref:Uncharacterized protein n=1 Tax=Idiomarina xiamenensis 10-D-4 TaxID=740709 RepID=K2JIZ3_9GAMM|nr:hypothetical protein A10D4_08242 [Idiomarina xiamenensis 10-D-4]
MIIRCVLKFKAVSLNAIQGAESNNNNQGYQNPIITIIMITDEPKKNTEDVTTVLSKAKALCNENKSGDGNIAFFIA